MQIDLPPRDGERPTTFGLEGKVFGVFGTIGNYLPELKKEEAGHVDRAVAKRRREYAAGRHFARAALTRLGAPATAILSGPSREPLWPSGIIGSIAHSDRFALALVGRRGEPFISLGVDIEINEQLSSDLLPIVFTQRELAEVDQAIASRLDSKLVFSAKEAVFKAVHPLAGQMIGFDEVEIFADTAKRSFVARYVGSNPVNVIMERGVGSFTLFEDHVACVFCIQKT